MKRFLRRLHLLFARDDLFLRVVWLVTGFCIAGFGVAMCVLGAKQDLGSRLQGLYWTVAIPIITCGGLLISRCAQSAQSRISRCLDAHLPDAYGEDFVALLVAIYLPAVLLTLLLRLLGVRGQRIRRMAPGKGKQIAGPRGKFPYPF
jgi:hypothetical protein